MLLALAEACLDRTAAEEVTAAFSWGLVAWALPIVVGVVGVFLVGVDGAVLLRGEVVAVRKGDEGKEKNRRRKVGAGEELLLLLLVVDLLREGDDRKRKGEDGVVLVVVGVGVVVVRLAGSLVEDL